MTNIIIEQAIFSRTGEADPELLAWSGGFLSDWQGTVKKTLAAFGVRPVGVVCPSAVFARPLGRQYVLVVQVADLDQSDTTRRPLGFHVLVIPRKSYIQFWHNPFAIAERVSPDWSMRGTLPELSWPAEPLPVRTVEQVRGVLQRLKGPPLSEEMLGEEQIEQHLLDHSESPALLGGVQILIDGGRLVFHRPQPDTDLLKALWTLLPNSNRGELWPASFAFSNDLQFDVLVVPRFNAEDYPGYTTEELAADYPEGRYEYQLQRAAEEGDQQGLNDLFERRSSNQTWRMGIILLVAVSMIVWFTRPIPLPPPPPQRELPARVYIASGLAGQSHNPLNVLPLVPLLSEEVWREVAQREKEPN